MQHYTINTGHVRDTARSEIDGAIIELLLPLLATGDYTMPHPFEDYELRVTVGGDVLAATVYSGAAPLATTVVCVDAAGLDNALRVLGASPTIALQPPAILVKLFPSISLDPSSTIWLGDFERCLGWAWVEKQGLN